MVSLTNFFVSKFLLAPLWKSSSLLGRALHLSPFTFSFFFHSLQRSRTYTQSSYFSIFYSSGPTVLKSPLSLFLAFPAPSCPSSPEGPCLPGKVESILARAQILELIRQDLNSSFASDSHGTFPTGYIFFLSLNFLKSFKIFYFNINKIIQVAVNKENTESTLIISMKNLSKN